MRGLSSGTFSGDICTLLLPPVSAGISCYWRRVISAALIHKSGQKNVWVPYLRTIYCGKSWNILFCTFRKDLNIYFCSSETHLREMWLAEKGSHLLWYLLPLGWSRGAAGEVFSVTPGSQRLFESQQSMSNKEQWAMRLSNRLITVSDKSPDNSQVFIQSSFKSWMSWFSLLLHCHTPVCHVFSCRVLHLPMSVVLFLNLPQFCLCFASSTLFGFSMDFLTL